MKRIITKSYGGQGSGHWGHEGRPGEVGGSSAGEGGGEGAVTQQPVKQRLEGFMDDLYTQTSQHPFDDRQRVFDKELVGVDASVFEGRIHLSSIISYGEKGKGLGTRVLSRLKELADKYQVELEGTAKAIPTAGASNKPSLTTRQLKTWYRKNGFKILMGDQIIYKPK